MSKKSVNTDYIFNLLAGKWSLKRKFIDNIDKNFSGTASGITQFLRNNKNTLLYHESVIARFDNGVKTEGTATYKFCIKNNKIHQYLVSFIKNEIVENPMFELDFSYTNDHIYACSSYLCGMDKYKVSYSFLDDHKFNIIYTVLGPNKNYITETEFEKSQGTQNNVLY